MLDDLNQILVYTVVQHTSVNCKRCCVVYCWHCEFSRHSLNSGSRKPSRVLEEEFKCWRGFLWFLKLEITSQVINWMKYESQKEKKKKPRGKVRISGHLSSQRPSHFCLQILWFAFFFDRKAWYRVNVYRQEAALPFNKRLLWIISEWITGKTVAALKTTLTHVASAYTNKCPKSLRDDFPSFPPFLSFSGEKGKMYLSYSSAESCVTIKYSSRNKCRSFYHDLRCKCPWQFCAF